MHMHTHKNKQGDTLKPLSAALGLHHLPFSLLFFPVPSFACAPFSCTKKKSFGPCSFFLVLACWLWPNTYRDLDAIIGEDEGGVHTAQLGRTHLCSFGVDGNGLTEATRSRVRVEGEGEAGKRVAEGKKKAGQVAEKVKGIFICSSCCLFSWEAGLSSSTSYRHKRNLAMFSGNSLTTSTNTSLKCAPKQLSQIGSAISQVNFHFVCLLFC